MVQYSVKLHLPEVHPEEKDEAIEVEDVVYFFCLSPLSC